MGVDLKMPNVVVPFNTQSTPLTYQTLIAYINGLYDDDKNLSNNDYQNIINFIQSGGEPNPAGRDLVLTRRGYKRDLVPLAQGELGYCLDTKELYIGGLNGNDLLTGGNTIVKNMADFGIVPDAFSENPTDNTPMFQAAVEWAKSQNKNITFFIPAGNYHCNGTIYINNVSNIAFTGLYTHPIIDGVKDTELFIIGDLATPSYLSNDITFDHVGFSNAGTALHLSNSASLITLTNLNFSTCHTCCHITGSGKRCSNIFISEWDCYGTGGNIVTADHVYRCFIDRVFTDNTLPTSPVTSAFSFYDYSYDIYIRDCNVSGFSDVLRVDTFEQVSLTDASRPHNIFLENLTCLSQSEYELLHVSNANNIHITNCFMANSQKGSGLRVQGVINIIVTNCDFSANGHCGAEFYTTNFIKFAHNITNNNGSWTDGSFRSGVYIGANCSNIIIMGNNGTDNQATKTQQYGCYIASVVTNLICTNNIYNANLVDGINMGTPASNTIIYENNIDL